MLNLACTWPENLGASKTIARDQIAGFSVSLELLTVVVRTFRQEEGVTKNPTNRVAVRNRTGLWREFGSQYPPFNLSSNACSVSGKYPNMDEVTTCVLAADQVTTMGKGYSPICW